MKNVLFIHQSSEMYGSDKTLLFLIQDIIDLGNINPIVVLPNRGPLSDELDKLGVHLIFLPIIKLSRGMFNFKNIISLPFLSLSSVIKLNNQLRGVEINVVYSNTLAVLLGALYSFLFRKKHIWHVHEIITKPKIIVRLYPFILSYFSEIIIFNSKASCNHIVKDSLRLSRKSIVIHNGIDRKISKNKENNFRKDILGFSDSDLIIVLVGRISRWKGQSLLLDVFNKIKEENNNVKLLFVGSTPIGQDLYLKELKESIVNYNLVSEVKIVPFQSNIWDVWDNIDIAVVPSTEPEPFGLVAVEAMLACKPLVVANHGGLCEIVEHKKTGLLFKPNDQDDLALNLNYLIKNRNLRKEISHNGQTHAREKFSSKQYSLSIEEKLLK